MSNFSKITNPLTNQTFSIFSTEGKNLLKNYVKQYKTGGMNSDDDSYEDSSYEDLLQEYYGRSYAKHIQRKERQRQKDIDAKKLWMIKKAFPQGFFRPELKNIIELSREEN